MRSSQPSKNLSEFDIKYGKNRINQFHIEEYLGRGLDANLSAEPMEIKFLK